MSKTSEAVAGERAAVVAYLRRKEERANEAARERESAAWKLPLGDTEARIALHEKLILQRHAAMLGTAADAIENGDHWA